MQSCKKKKQKKERKKRKKRKKKEKKKKRKKRKKKGKKGKEKKIKRNKNSHLLIILKLSGVWYKTKWKEIMKIGVNHLFNNYNTDVEVRALTPFPWLLHFTLNTYLIMLSVKQGGIKYHFYDSTWHWTPGRSVYIYIYIYIYYKKESMTLGFMLSAFLRE